TTPGAFATTPTGNDVFVTKLNPTGSGLVYSTFLGRSGGAAAVAVDTAGNAYVTGGTSALDFPTTVDGVRPRFNGGPSDAFVTKCAFGDVALSISALSVSPSTVAGGASSTGTITLSAAAVAAGATVTLASSNTAVAGVPASATVPAGATSASFTITTTPV